MAMSTRWAGTMLESGAMAGPFIRGTGLRAGSVP